jgi:predicted amidohydrolase
MIVATVQMDVNISEKAHNLATVLAKPEAAARGGPKLVVFPECALTGYCFASREEPGPLGETVPLAIHREASSRSQGSRLHYSCRTARARGRAPLRLGFRRGPHGNPGHLP